FADHARAMHHGEMERRNIRGHATPEVVTELLEEGEEVMPLPLLPPAKETLQKLAACRASGFGFQVSLTELALISLTDLALAAGVARVLRRTLAGGFPGSPPSRRQHRDRSSSSVATANGACARRPHQPPRVACRHASGCFLC